MNSGSAFLAFCLSVALAGPSVVLAQFEITTEVAPPPPRLEHAPPARDGYAWSAGHWEWSGHAYYWVTGTWLVQRGSARYIAGRWEQEGTRWHFVPGHWQR